MQTNVSVVYIVNATVMPYAMLYYDDNNKDYYDDEAKTTKTRTTTTMKLPFIISLVIANRVFQILWPFLGHDDRANHYRTKD